MISDLAKISLKNLKKRKLRAFLTLLGILIAVSTIFMLISLSLGLQDAVKEQFRLLGADKFFIQPAGQLGAPGTGGAVELTQEDLDVVRKIPGVKDATYFTAANAKIEFENEIRYVMAIGIDLDSADLFVETGSYKADEGRLIKKGDKNSIMIGAQYKYNNFFKKPVKAGDKFIINDLYAFEVKGILTSLGNPQDDRMIMMPIEELRSTFNIPDRIDQIVVQVDDETQIKEIAEKTKKKLLNSRDLTEKTIDFIVLTPEELLASFSSVLSIITGFLLGIAAISLLVGGIGIANTMYTSVLERTKEIGVMKSIGARNSDILLIFLLESGFLGLIGGIAGVTLGILVAKSIEFIAVNQLGTNLLHAAMPFSLIGGCLLFALVIGAVSGALPAYRASRIIPVDALRYE